MTDTRELRPIEPDEFPAFFAVGLEAFNSPWPVTAQEYELMTFEFDRSAAAFDGDQIVGTSCAYTMDLSVPGGSVSAGGISAISVLPTHRRRGIMSAMIGHHLADIAGRGEPVAALFASEAAIYGRFGFGCASDHLRLTIRRGEGRLLPPALADSGGPGQPAPEIRLAEPRDTVDDLAAVYAAEAARRPGMPARDDRWWRLRTADPEFSRNGLGPLRGLVARDASGPVGYALYAVHAGWDEGIPAGMMRIHELIGLSQAATAALWADLLSRDLVSEVSAGMRPADDTVLHLLADRRRARAQLTDGLWIRLTDVPAALSRRRYAREVDLVIEVADPLMPGNAGRWQLRAGPDGRATCERTDGEADVVASVHALGAAYLGGPRLGALAAAGHVAQQRPGAVAELSAALSWDPAPWCPMTF